MPKPEFEFFPTKDIDFTPSSDNNPLIKERILSKDPDTQMTTSILCYDPGADTSDMGVQIHNFWEEIYILEGSFFDISLGKTFQAGDYACRPPGMPHPWRTNEGTLMFVVCYTIESEIY